VQCKLGSCAERTNGAAADRVHRKHANDHTRIAGYAFGQPSDATEQPGNSAGGYGNASVGHGNSGSSVHGSWIELDQARDPGKHHSAFDHRSEFDAGRHDNFALRIVAANFGEWFEFYLAQHWNYAR